MKKTTALLLCILTIFSCAVIPTSAAEKELKLTVVNDLHLDLKDATAEEVKKRNSVSEEYFHASSGGQLPYESVAIIRAFLRDAAKSDSNTVLMPGDLTTVGTVEEHTAFIALIKEFEETTGKKVFVIPGNHDLFDVTVEEFEALYADFGYGEALANDPDTASYTAELGGKYRLLAIDSNEPGKSPHGVDDKLVSWVKAQCEAAKKDGKYLIAMMHHNLTAHIVLVEIFHPSAVVSNTSTALADTLADNGVKYIFTAHTHDQDIAKYTSKNGNVLYDCVTASLNAYPCVYREVTFGEQVKITTKNVTSIDTSLLPTGINDNAMALAKSDFLAYAKNCTYTGITETITAYTKPKTLKKYIKTDDPELQASIDPAIDKVCEAVQLPLYKKDEVEEGKSIESLAASLGTTLPETNYKNLVEVAVVLYQAHAEGDENYPAYTDEMIILQRSVAIVLNYAMSDLNADDYSRVLGFVLNLLGVEISPETVESIGGALEQFKGNELLLTTALMPLLTRFSVDEAPADNNVTLPGYAAEKEEVNFLQLVIDFFKGIIDFFRSLFAMFG